MYFRHSVYPRPHPLPGVVPTPESVVRVAPLPEAAAAARVAPADVNVSILHQAFERVFITVSFKYGPFSMSKKKTAPVTKKIIWEKVDKLPLQCIVF